MYKAHLFYWSKKNLNMSREIVASKPCIDLKSYRKIYSYNETKEKNCLFDEALCHIGYNKLDEEFWCGEGCEWFRWIYKYEGEDIAIHTIHTNTIVGHTNSSGYKQYTCTPNLLQWGGHKQYTCTPNL